MDQATQRPKRGHGEGTIYLRKSDSRWVGTIMLGRKADGRPDRPKVTGSTRGAVQKQLATLRRTADKGMRADPDKAGQTVAAYLETWLGAARTSTRIRTWERYSQIVRLHIVPTLGRHKLSALRPDAVQTLYASKLVEGLAPRTVEKIHAVLHRALEMAVKWDYVPRNVADAVDKPTVPKHDIRPPDPAELTKLLDASGAYADRLADSGSSTKPPIWQHPLWTLAIYSGCRQGELLGLAWSDLDLDAATLTVRRGLTGVKNHIPRFGEPKSETSRRTISVPSEAIAVLRAHKARQATEQLAAADWADNGLVFATHVGTPLIARNVVRDFKAALRRAGLPSTVRFHDLRHAHATLMLRAGVPLKVASGRLGHSGIGITANLYQHVGADMDVDASDRAARAMRVAP